MGSASPAASSHNDSYTTPSFGVTLASSHFFYGPYHFKIICLFFYFVYQIVSSLRAGTMSYSYLYLDAHHSAGHRIDAQSMLMNGLKYMSHSEKRNTFYFVSYMLWK